MTPYQEQTVRHWSIVAGLVGAGLVVWAVGLWLSAPATIALVGWTAVAVAQLWRIAARR